MHLTLRQFVSFLDEIGSILKLELGSDITEPRSLTGEAAHKAAMRMFGSKKDGS